MKKALDSKWNARSPIQFYECIIRNGGVSNVTVMLGTIEEGGKGFNFGKKSFPITHLNHFEFSDKGTYYIVSYISSSLLY